MITNGRKINRLPPLKIFLSSIGFIVVLIMEGLGSRFGLWKVTNHIRLLLGLFCGGAISMVLLPLCTYFLRRDSFDKAAIDTLPKYLGMFLVIGLLFGLYFVPHICIFQFLSLFSILGLLLVYLMMNATISAILVNYRHKESSLLNISWVIVLTLILTSGELWLLKIVHS